MKKTIALILMLSTMLSLFGIGMHTGAVSENVLKYTPVIDGVIDDAYLWSYTSSMNGSPGWALGKYEADQLPKIPMSGM